MKCKDKRYIPNISSALVTAKHHNNAFYQCPYCKAFHLTSQKSYYTSLKELSNRDITKLINVFSKTRKDVHKDLVNILKERELKYKEYVSEVEKNKPYSRAEYFFKGK